MLQMKLCGDLVLREKCELVTEITPDVLDIMDEMVGMMHEQNGVGLAAPQVGVPTRILIVDGRELVDAYPYLKDFTRVMINPVVVEESSRTCEYSEGCLSVPGIYADVRRPESIRVEYFNDNFEKVSETFDKFACRMIQHELDHLDGRIFVDRVAPIRKKMIAKKLLNISRGKVSARYKTKLD